MIEEQIQRSLQWKKARWGNFTGSRISELMGKSRTKGETWTATAKSYIYEVAAERDFDPIILNDDELFAEYLQSVSFSSKAMQWGTEYEDEAKEVFRAKVFPTLEIAEVGSCRHDTVEHFAASPDGLIYLRDGEDLQVLEIKCPTISTFTRYRCEIHDAESLKTVKPEYYWQMQAEMACTGAECGWFVVYQPKLLHSLHYCKIERNEEDIKAMLDRVRLANEAVNNINN